MIADSDKTTTPSYWLNWRFFICALFLLAYLIMGMILIWIFEGPKKLKIGDRENQKVDPGVIYEEEVWNTSFKCIHPAWLLGFRAFAFMTLLTLLVIDFFVDGISIFFFYTQWTFTFVTSYFLLGSILSMYGCQKHRARAGADSADHVSYDPEQGTYISPTAGEVCADSSDHVSSAPEQGTHISHTAGEVCADSSDHVSSAPEHGTHKSPTAGEVCADSSDHVSSAPEQGIHISPTPGETADSSNESEHFDDCKRAGSCIYAFQIMYQVSAGASMLTDLVFWIILFPFLNDSEHGVNLMLVIFLHTMNAGFLFGDAILNCMRFPFFRIAYFFLWTTMFVLFQWLVHAYINIWWPYPFLDLAPFYAPLWYLGVGVMHIPAYGVFALVVKLKDVFFSRLFPVSYRKIT